jgi:hypothetical protein
VFIDDDDTLETAYGHRVPVLRCNEGRELEWSLDVEAAALAASSD